MLAALLAATACAYWPGLQGGFLFDDYVNLDALGSRGPIDDWPAFWRYITSGTADPTGRPLALLSFLLDARDWPAQSGPFLRTNLILHLVNGVLLFVLLRQSGRTLGWVPASNDRIALAAAGMWLLHPLWVSTTLYVIQREAMLPATFTLIGLIAYGRGRERFIASDGRSGALAMVAAITVGTFLAVTSKANGALLPVLALVLVATVHARRDAYIASLEARRRLLWLDRGLLLLPTLAILAYLAHFLGQLHAPLGVRPWTIGERLLTEPRVLLDYLQLLLVPRSVSTGLFNDDYPASSGLLQPWTTLPAIAGMLAIAFLGWRCRHRYPAWSAAILFYLAGHLLESTTVPLELYFEHRNYLPAMLFFWPLAQALLARRDRLASRTLVSILILALLAATTWQRTTLWGHPERLAALWAARNPDSPRAQANAAISLVQQGRAPEAVAQLDTLRRRFSDDLQIAVNFINARCANGGLLAGDAEYLRRVLARSRGSDLLLHQWLDRAITTAENGDCPGMDLPALDAWLEAAEKNPTLSRRGLRGQTLQPLLGRLALARGDADTGLGHYRAALESYPNPDFAARLVSSLAASGHPRQALALLDEYQQTLADRAGTPAQGMPRLHAYIMDRQGFWPHEFSALRSKIEEDIDLGPASPETTR